MSGLVSRCGFLAPCIARKSLRVAYEEMRDLSSSTVYQRELYLSCQGGSPGDVWETILVKEQDVYISRTSNG